MRRLRILKDVDTDTCYIAEFFPSIVTEEEEMFIHSDRYIDEDHARDAVKVMLDE